MSYLFSKSIFYSVLIWQHLSVTTLTRDFTTNMKKHFKVITANMFEYDKIKFDGIHSGHLAMN